MRRAAALLGALALACVGAATAVPAATADENGDTLLFADYADGRRNSGEPLVEFNECCAHSIQTAGLGRGDPVDAGDYGIRHELRHGDVDETGVRAESHNIKMEEARFGHGVSLAYGFSVYIPSTWETDTVEDIVFQWHNFRDACEPQKWPSAFLTVQPSGQWRLRWNSDAGACTTADTIVKESADLGAVRKGQWTDFAFAIDWAHDDTGRIRAWTRTTGNPAWSEVLDHAGPNTYNDDGPKGYIKWGVYKPAWGAGPSAITKRAVFHDNVAVGATCLSVVRGSPPPCEEDGVSAAPAHVPAAFDPPRTEARARRP